VFIICKWICIKPVHHKNPVLVGARFYDDVTQPNKFQISNFKYKKITLEGCNMANIYKFGLNFI
jgi:hypothetical protein